MFEIELYDKRFKIDLSFFRRPVGHHWVATSKKVPVYYLFIGLQTLTILKNLNWLNRRMINNALVLILKFRKIFTHLKEIINNTVNEDSKISLFS
jgi:hypothetical protein